MNSERRDEGEKLKESCTNSRPYVLSTPLGGIHITSTRPSLPTLHPSSVEEDADHAADTGIRFPVGSKQLRVFLPRTPSSPCPSPFSGPWHRSGDSSSGSSSKSSTPSPASNKSSPASPPESGIEALMDLKLLTPNRLSVSPREADFPRLTRRHTFPKHSVLQDVSKASDSRSDLQDSATPETKTVEQPFETKNVEHPFRDIPSSLEEAVTSQQPEMVSYYLQHGNSPDGDPNSQVSPLILAASVGNEKIVRMLLAAGANIDYEDKNKGTALHHAAAGGHRGVIKLLLVAGANMFHKTEDGHLAVQLTNDSRIRHLLTCRMRSSSEPNLAQDLGNLETPGSRSTVVDSKEAAVSPRIRSPTIRPAKVSVSNPVSIRPLPCEHGFVDTTMQRVSPRSESPKNIQRVMEQKKEKLKEMEGKDDEEELPKEQRIVSPKECSIEFQHGQDGSRPRRKSVQFIEEVPLPKAKEKSVACQICGESDCGGKCQEHQQREAAPATVSATATASTSTSTTLAASGTASSSQAVTEKLFPRPESKTTGKFKWTKGELLGEGAYGKVFSGLNQSTGELMAVKQLKIDPGEGQENAFYLNALEREINLYKKLRHKHIVGYINMEQEEDSKSLYIFLEYVSGGSIQSMLERFGRFSESLVRVYTRQLLLGLQYLHDNRIVHRDIKGGNVLVDAVGVVKLADFGASKAFHDPTVTNECKSIRGSVFWMAPEVIKGDGYGRRADIWSVGCTVIEMLTAMHPWPDIDNTWSAIFHIAKASSGPPIPELGSDCVKDFMQQCFQLDPRLRPTATQLLEHRFVAVDSDDQRPLERPNRTGLIQITDRTGGIQGSQPASD